MSQNMQDMTQGLTWISTRRSISSSVPHQSRLHHSNQYQSHRRTRLSFASQSITQLKFLKGLRTVSTRTGAPGGYPSDNDREMAFSTAQEKGNEQSRSIPDAWRRSLMKDRATVEKVLLQYAARCSSKKARDKLFRSTQPPGPSAVK